MVIKECGREGRARWEALKSSTLTGVGCQDKVHSRHSHNSRVSGKLFPRYLQRQLLWRKQWNGRSLHTHRGMHAQAP